jgi:hypothetical protein
LHGPLPQTHHVELKVHLATTRVALIAQQARQGLVIGLGTKEHDHAVHRHLIMQMQRGIVQEHAPSQVIIGVGLEIKVDDTPRGIPWPSATSVAALSMDKSTLSGTKGAKSSRSNCAAKSAA